MNLSLLMVSIGFHSYIFLFSFLLVVRSSYQSGQSALIMSVMLDGTGGFPGMSLK